MGMRAVKSTDPPEAEPCDVLEICPICQGSMETVYSRSHQKVCVCVDCHTTITVPAKAWQMRGEKRR
jgi:hypothetical protein